MRTIFNNRPLPFLVLSFSLFLAATLNLLSDGFAEGTRIHYAVSIPDPASETFVVTADIYGVTPDTMTFYFPVWAPGAYDIINFGTYVREFSATTGKGKALEAVHPDVNTWKIVSPSDHVRLQYVVQDIEAVDNSAWFSLSDIEDSTKVAFAVGTALFGYPDGYHRYPLHRYLYSTAGMEACCIA